MQKKVYNDKSNLFKVIIGSKAALNAEEFRERIIKLWPLNLLSVQAMRDRLSPVVLRSESQINEKNTYKQLIR